MKVLNIRVAGVTFEGRQDIISRMQGQEVVRIEPEPQNPYDPNALAVKVAFPPESKWGIAHVGYIPKDMAAIISPVLDGESLMVEIAEITGGFETYNGGIANYGLRLRVELPDDVQGTS